MGFGGRNRDSKVEKAISRWFNKCLFLKFDSILRKKNFSTTIFEEKNRKIIIIRKWKFQNPDDFTDFFKKISFFRKQFFYFFPRKWLCWNFFLRKIESNFKKNYLWNHRETAMFTLKSQFWPQKTSNLKTPPIRHGGSIFFLVVGCAEIFFPTSRILVWSSFARKILKHWIREGT